MRSLQDEIRKVQQNLFCPICRRPFSLQDIQLHALTAMGKAELALVCSRGHFPIILIVPISLKEAISFGPISKQEYVRVSKKINQAVNSIEEIWKK